MCPFNQPASVVPSCFVPQPQDVFSREIEEQAEGFHMQSFSVDVTALGELVLGMWFVRFIFSGARKD